MIQSICETLGSVWLTILVIALVTLFCIAGAVLPQKGHMSDFAIAAWQNRFPTLSAVADPLGLFDVFNSTGFLITCALFALNLFGCIIAWLQRGGGLRQFTGPMAIRRCGFFLMHVSLILLVGGGVLTCTMDLNGTLFLTEGQTVREVPESYKTLDAGAWRRVGHSGRDIRLRSVDVGYADGDRRVAVASTLEYSNDENHASLAIVEVNRPVEIGGLSFTQDDTGFSPRLRITHAARKLPLGHPFIALDTRKNDSTREYSGEVLLPLTRTPARLTLYPTAEPDGSGFSKTGDAPRNPMLEIALKDTSGKYTNSRYIRLGESTQVGQFLIEFTELRQWASFRIGDDPGYPFILAALWIGLLAMLLRYYDDMKCWAKESVRKSPRTAVQIRGAAPVRLPFFRNNLHP